MSDTPPDPSMAPPNGAPSMRMVNQYLKDLSFENPGAPHSARPDLPAPQVDVGVDVNARKLGEDQYEVELACNVTAARDGKPVFVTEVNYAGHLHVQNVTEEQLQVILLVEAPRLLFPFARQVIATATREGGFLPLMLEPLDFANMYRMQMQQRAEAGQDGPPPVGTA